MQKADQALLQKSFLVQFIVLYINVKAYSGLLKGKGEEREDAKRSVRKSEFMSNEQLPAQEQKDSEDSWD